MRHTSTAASTVTSTAPSGLLCSTPADAGSLCSMPVDTGVQKVVASSPLGGMFGGGMFGGHIRIDLSIRESSVFAHEQDALDRDRHDCRNRPYLGTKSNHYLQSRDRSCLAAIPTW